MTPTVKAKALEAARHMDCAHATIQEAVTLVEDANELPPCVRAFLRAATHMAKAANELRGVLAPAEGARDDD